MSADRAPAVVTVGGVRDDSGVAAVGRLLWVGVVAGVLIGGLVAALVSGDVDIFSIGAMVGAVAGATIQAVNAAVLFAARRRHRSPSGPLMRAVVVPLPAAGALATSLLMNASYSARGWFVVIGGAAAAALVAWLVAPWCLSPITIVEREKYHR